VFNPPVRFVATVLLGVLTASSGWTEPPLAEIKHSGPVRCVAWSFDGKVVASAGESGVVILADPANGKTLRQINVLSPVNALAFSRNGTMLAAITAAQTQPLGIWSTENGNLLKRGGFVNYTVDCLAFTADGDSIIAAGVGQQIHWQHAKGGASGSKMGGKLEGAAAVSWDGNLAAWGQTNGQVRLYHADLRKYTNFQGPGVRALAFAPDGTTLAIGTTDKTIRLWDTVALREVGKLEGLREVPAKIAFSGNGRVLAAVGPTDATVRLWDVPTGRLKRQLNTNRATINDLALSPDGRTLVTAGADGKAYLWSVAVRDLGPINQPLKLTPQELADLWGDLGSSDYTRADNAFRKLGAAGDNAVPFLKEQVRKVAIPPIDEQRVVQLIKDLDSRIYAVRARAFVDLGKYGELVEATLKQLLASRPSEEVRRRATQLLDKMREPAPTPDRTRALETIELLAALRTAESRAALEEIARDALIPRIRQEAGEALQWLAKGQDGTP
jgi:WD40 repeat protein